MYFIYTTFIIHFHGNIWTYNYWPAPNVSGFIAQLVRASHRYREVTGFKPPLKSWIFFRLLYAIAYNCIHNCEDQPSFGYHYFPLFLICSHHYKFLWNKIKPNYPENFPFPFSFLCQWVRSRVGVGEIIWDTKGDQFYLRYFTKIDCHTAN